SAFSPDLPGCVATGSTKEEVQKNMREAVTFHVEGMHEESIRIPQTHSFSTYLEIPV
ncbi:MAG: type II toxin-antitoxin system HicB family antitoxin, partial [bacterium]